jgi:hypothetical protein
MAVAAYFNPEGMTVAQFEEVHRRLAEAGADMSGRLHHSAFGEDGSMQVYEVWESPEALQAFGATLMPIIAEVGIKVGPPMVMPIHRLEQEQREIIG